MPKSILRRWLSYSPFGRRRRGKHPPSEPVYFSRLENLTNEEWKAALIESPAKAASWVYAAATAGNIDAQLAWANMLLDGHGTKRDPARAFRWFGIAALSKRADAINMLGRCHERGWGTPIDFEKAAACYGDAAEKSLDWAQYNLASLMLDGKIATRDSDKAFDLLMKAVKQGHIKSLNLVGHCYEHGSGCSKNMNEAEQWYFRSAEGGDFRGQYRYSELLFSRGLVDEALLWLRAAIGSAPARFCAELADQLLTHPEPRLRAMEAYARVRAGKDDPLAPA